MTRRGPIENTGTPQSAHSRLWGSALSDVSTENALRSCLGVGHCLSQNYIHHHLGKLLLLQPCVTWRVSAPNSRQWTSSEK